MFQWVPGTKCLSETKFCFILGPLSDSTSLKSANMPIKNSVECVPFTTSEVYKTYKDKNERQVGCYVTLDDVEIFSDTLSIFS